MKTLARNILILTLACFASSMSSTLLGSPCDALIYVENPETSGGKGSILVEFIDLTVTHNVLIWTPSGDIPAVQLSEGVWFMDNLPPSPTYMALAFAYDNNGNEICEVHYASPIIPLDSIIIGSTGTITGKVNKFQTIVDQNNDVIEATIPVKDAFMLATEADGTAYSCLSDETGYYEFLGLIPGEYIVQSLEAEVGCYDISDTDETDDGDAHDLLDPANNQIPVSLELDEIDDQNNFLDGVGNGSISGYVLLDSDGNFEGDEPLVGISINIYHPNGEPARNADGEYLAEIVTDETGYYEFTDLPIGSYTLIESQPEGYANVSDGDESYDGDEEDAIMNKDNIIIVKLKAAEHDTDNNFVEIISNKISGYVLSDMNGDNLGDTPIPNIEIRLSHSDGSSVVDQNDKEVLSVETNEDGYYEFVDLIAGSYLIEQIQPLSYINVCAEDMSNDDSVDVLDTDHTDDIIPVSLKLGEEDTNNDFVEKHSCIASDPNTYLSIGIATSPSIISSENDLVNLTFVVLNNGPDYLSSLELETEISLLNAGELNLSLNPVLTGDPNGNGFLDPNETWYYTAVRQFPINLGDDFVISAEIIGEGVCTTEIGTAGNMITASSNITTINELPEERTIGLNKKKQEGEITIFPNPVTDFVSFYSESETEELNVVIATLTGTKVVNKIVRTGQRLDLSDLTPAQYHVMVQNSEMRLISNKLITIIR